MPDSRRSEALALSEELLTDIEYTRVAPADIARKASRLARLLDDSEAVRWLHFEVSGYTPTSLGYMSQDEIVAAERSNRLTEIDQTGYRKYNTNSIGEIQAHIEAANASLAALGGAGPGGDHALLVEQERRNQRYAIWGTISSNQRYLDGVLGAIHGYVSERYQELRFGSTVEGAFGTVRADVDAAIARLVPSALPRLTAAFENAASAQPEHWANAASTCRKLLKEVADALRPPGPDVDGRKMGDEHYINRLVDWIVQQTAGKTAKDLAVADLEYLGRRLDASASAGHKGAHADVSRFDASRFLIGTYLVLGDVLRLTPPAPASPPSEVATAVGEVAPAFNPPDTTEPAPPGGE